MPEPSSTEDILNIVANQLNRADAVKKENIVKPASQKAAEEDNEEAASSDEEDTKVADVNSEEAYTENDTSQKKSGFFSRFKKKNK